MIGALIMIMMSSLVFGDIQVKNLRFIDEVIDAPDTLRTHMFLDADDDVENVRVTVVIPDLALRVRLSAFDMDEDGITKRAFLDVPQDVVPGYYLARVTVTSEDEDRRVKHRFFWVQ